VGTLYLVGTPIGNLEDITLRALRILEEASLIAAEDTRRTRVLLDRHQISTPMLSYFEGNKLSRLDGILEALGAGDVALVSEAGMPGLSDPGYELVQAALREGHLVTPIPGPSAPVAALVASGLPTDRFLFMGFVPRRRAARRDFLQQVVTERSTLVLFETPRRLLATLAEIEAVLGDRPIALCRELTKKFEEIWRGTVAQARAHFAETAPRGEFTLVVGGATDQETWSEAQVSQELAELLGRGLSRSEAAREIALRSGWSRREVYNTGLSEDDDDRSG
jgi:16S rRNA (cytidine1402-2'-O)-methyltransferase